MRVFLVLCCLLFPVHAMSAQVVSVVDGDTLIVREYRKSFIVRLYGVDCPEKDQTFGMEARNVTLQTLKGQDITVHSYSTDKYGRTVATVELESGQTLQEVLLDSGAAWVYPQFCKNVLPCVSWQWLEWRARWKKAGLWAQAAPVAPWQWRQKNSGKVSLMGE